MALLDIRNLSIDIETAQGKIRVIDKASLNIVDGSIHGLIGESGSGKTLIAKAILGLHNSNWTVTADRMFLGKTDLSKLSQKERRQILGTEISMIFQEPSSYLDPSQKIHTQIESVLPKKTMQQRFRRILSKIKRVHISSRRLQIKELLHKVGIQNDVAVLNCYPHQLSEGVCQKVMIAMAIANNPRLIIADEPTTSMEAVTQSQIFRLLYKLNQLNNTTLLILSNNFANTSGISDYMTLVYCGQTVESGSYKQIMGSAMHPYTQAMLKTMINNEEIYEHKAQLYTLPGNIPSSNQLPIGCRLGPRCPRAQRICVKNPTLTIKKGHSFRCHYPIKLS
ncbi:oligopeptide/dipeptide ABC transporter ATP-binding protein [uncultured Psychromonas sp.]|jgi:cationic peptide transport system ATP-binding protein|uniref:oligopeptide/dipeptide ABC transporter ATP-binding protein n=1 Tax=uncultured Psychromonas sp. TaxID=173974 RepID=UPI00260DB92B|nr:oligopeptide/dipeptide ABC transporter ATP-binding protein [uncultured Psychromonas sp.]